MNYNYISMWKGQIKYGDVEILWARIEERPQGCRITLRIAGDIPENIPNGDLVIRSKGGKDTKYIGCNTISIKGNLVVIAVA